MIRVWAALVWCGCNGAAPDRPSPPEAGAARPVVVDAATPTLPPGETPVVRRSRALMGTIFEILVVDSPGARTDEAIEAAFAEIARLEEMMSEWRPNSEVSHVNAAAGREAVRVSPELLEVLATSRTVAEHSGGAFDVTWAALRDIWHFRGEDLRPPTAAQARARSKLVDWHQMTVDETARTVKLERPGMALGLGGIAKGYALDRASAILKSKGLVDFVLYAGGQVLVSGKRGDRPWRVGIQHPRREDVYFAYFSPGSGSVSTSGDYQNFFVHDGVRYHHILDPTTGMPARAAVAVTVLAPSALAADAWDTAIFILGPERGMELARREGLEALFIDPQLRVTMTPGFRRELTFTMPLTTESPPVAPQR